MLDYLFLAYFIWRIIKGYLNGVGIEVKNLFFSLLFLCGVLGIFILSELTGLIKTTLQTVLNSTGFLISFGSVFAAIFLFFFIRGKVADYSEQQFSGKTANYIGALVGALRSIVVMWVVLKYSLILANSAFYSHRLWRTSPFFTSLSELYFYQHFPFLSCPSSSPHKAQILLIQFKSRRNAG